MRPLVVGCAPSLLPVCQVIYRVSCAGLSRWVRPSFIQQRDLNPELNLTALLYHLSYVGMCGLPFARPLSSFVRYTAHSHTDRSRPSHLARVEGLDPSSCGFGDRCSALNYTHIKARQLRVLHGVQVISKLIFNALPSYIQKLATYLHAFASCVRQRLAAICLIRTPKLQRRPNELLKIHLIPQ